VLAKFIGSDGTAERNTHAAISTKTPPGLNKTTDIEEHIQEKCHIQNDLYCVGWGVTHSLSPLNTSDDSSLDVDF